jgi:signal transduction histidine kinase
MPRAEFATYGAEIMTKPLAIEFAAVPAAVTRRAPWPGAEPALKPFMRILLIEENPQKAEKISSLLSGIFGDRCARDWVADLSQSAELIRQNLHDIYLVSEGEAAGDVLEIIRSNCNGPAIVLAARPERGADMKAISAGAADYLSLDDMTADRFERAIRHALVRQQDIVRGRQAVEDLTNEKTRLNLLRDANHRFVENTCHDFRSPLTVIKEFAAIIAEGLAGEVSEEQAEFLQIILTRVDHLSHMVDGILDASRLESDLIGVNRQEQLVTQLIEQARSTLEQRAEAHNVQIEFAIPEKLPSVFADAESIGRVVVNLGTNACKYAGENGKIRVWARYNPNGKDVTVGITDNGPGIAPEHVRLIFDRFQQLPKDKADGKDGFGLGLHIASELVRVNFGTLSVDSEPQKGSTFAFTIPIFDVNVLIPLYFSFLSTARHSFQKVSIAIVTTCGDPESATLADVERSLQRQLRPYDLLLRLREGSWLACLAGDSAELTKVTERILGTYAEIGRNRPEGRLPEIRFRSIGTWGLTNRIDGLTEVIRRAYSSPADTSTKRRAAARDPAAEGQKSV